MLISYKLTAYINGHETTVCGHTTVVGERPTFGCIAAGLKRGIDQDMPDFAAAVHNVSELQARLRNARDNRHHYSEDEGGILGPK